MAAGGRLSSKMTVLKRGRVSAPSANGGQPWNTLRDWTSRWKRLRFV
jgi:hypothetical protein